MLDYRYQQNWDQQLTQAIQAARVNTQSQAKATNDNNVTQTVNKNQSANFVAKLLENSRKISDSAATSLTWMLIEKTLNSFNADDSLHGLFVLLNSTDKKVSPFIATHDYRIHVLTCEETGDILINISPIYRLGPEFPTLYQQKYGKKLEKEAIIRLFTNNDSLVAFHPTGEKAYTLGIDAGMALENSKIHHNKQLHLKLEFNDSGITANLHCETQAMTKTFTWEELDTQKLFCPIPDTDICVAG